MTSTQMPYSIAVVGGGIAGLTLALGLLKHKILVTLYESASAFGEIGAGVSFGPNAAQAMALIDPAIEAGFARRSTTNSWPSKQGFWFEFRTGMELKGRHEEVGGKVTEVRYRGDGNVERGSVHRAHFLEEMVKLLPEGIAQFHKRLVDYVDEGDRGVLLRFADGSEARHDALIGTDGIKSRTRQLLLGEDHPATNAVFSGKCAYRGLIPMEKAKEMLGEELAVNSQMYLGYHGHVLTFPIEKGNTMNVVAFTSKETWPHKDWVLPFTKEDMFADFAGWSPTVTHILQMMQKSTIWALFNHPSAPTFTKSRVCLLGDAAHASTPHQGAGAGMAIEDVYVMISALAEVKEASDIPRAFEAFDAVRRPRATRLVDTSRQAGQLYDFEQEGVGDDLDKIKELLQTRMKWIWEVDLQGEAARVKELFHEGR